ncbi:MAG TPA: nitrite/sulfite reductase, partial [Chloroflexota bacterium]|nr:nitrite/sulfite reductase [Chloroflexota bacterium]
MARETKQLPGPVIPILEEEFEDFDTEAGEFLRGNTEEATFIGFRLKQGVYGQRQPDRQMIRVKLPFGGVNSEQLRMLGDVAEDYAPLKKGHLTTRENVQYHHGPLPLATKALRTLAKVGLSSREACGNTVRNVTGDAWAGIARDEIFDPTPYAGALVRYFVRNPLTQLLPRKFKVSFSGSDTDRVLGEIHDMAYISRVKQVDGKEVQGFRILAGGGLSIFARNTLELYDFVSVDDYLRVTEAVLRIFERSDDLRRNRAKARIKFLIHRVGIDAFREMVDEELRDDWAKKDYPLESLLFLDDEERDAPAGPATAPEIDPADRELFERFVASNVVAQRQAGYSAIEV